MKVNNRDDCWAVLVDTVTDLLEEQGNEPGEITPQTLLNADLGISSVEAIHLMIMLEDRLSSPLSFEKLAVRDGEYMEDLSAAELHGFLAESLGLPA